MGAALAVSRAPKSHCPAWCSQSWASCWVLRRAQKHFRCLVPSVPPPVRDAWNPSSHPSAWPEAVGRIPLSGQALEVCMCWWGWRPPGMQPSPSLLQDGLWVVVTALAAGTHISPAAPSALWSAGSSCFAAGDALWFSLWHRVLSASPAEMPIAFSEPSKGFAQKGHPVNNCRIQIYF